MSINEHESDGDIVSKKPLLDEHLDKSKPTKEKTPLLEHPTHQHESILFAFHQLPEYLKDNGMFELIESFFRFCLWKIMI